MPRSGAGGLRFRVHGIPCRANSSHGELARMTTSLYFPERSIFDFRLAPLSVDTSFWKNLPRYSGYLTMSNPHTVKPFARRPFVHPPRPQYRSIATGIGKLLL